MISNWLRKAITAVSGLAAVVLVLLLITPRAVRGVVATLVQVVNTTANPVPNLDTERNARIPYQSSPSFSAFSAGMQHLRIPAKLNAVSEGKPNGIPG